MLNLSMKWRIGLGVTILVILAIGAVSLLAYAEYKEGMLGSLDRRLKNSTSMIQDLFLKNDPLVDSDQRLKETFVLFPNLNEVDYKIWFEGDEVLFCNRPAMDSLSDQILSENPDIEWPKGRFVTNVTCQGEPLRALWAKSKVHINEETPDRELNIIGYLSTANIHKEEKEFLQEILIIGGLVIWGGVIGMLTILRWGLRPLDQLIAQMEKISRNPTQEISLESPAAVKELLSFITSWKQMLKRLSLAMDEHKRFTSDISHELRTPMATVKSTLQLARSQRRSVEYYEQTLDRSLEDLDRMNQLIDKLLELSRLENGALARAVESIEMKDFLEKLIVKYQPIVAGFGKKLQSTLCSVTISGDRLLLEQLMTNLLDNAVKYSSEASVISVQMKKKHSFLEIIVHDEGGHIPLEEQANIFKRFYRVDKARSRDSGGLGLGLAIADEIVQLHGGTISVVSSCDAGTDFVIMLPLMPPKNELIEGE